MAIYPSSGTNYLLPLSGSMAEAPFDGNTGNLNMSSGNDVQPR